MNKQNKQRPMLKVVLTVEATFGLDQLEDLTAWKDECTGSGSIIDEHVEVVYETT